MRTIKVEWCENFIRSYFFKHQCKGVYTKLMFEAAEKAGLYEKNTFGSAFSQALENVTTVDNIYDTNGDYAFSVFRLA